MRVVVVGSGYVGLVSGACLAELGIGVTCVDKDTDRVAELRRGGSPIYEPGLDTMLCRGRRAGLLAFSDTLPDLEDVDLVLLAVGTPPRPDGQGADLSQVLAAAREVVSAAKTPLVLVTKSTVPAGTGDEIEAMATAIRPDVSIVVASNPEFLREGSAVTDFMNPDRIVVGAEDENARIVLARLYAPLTATGAELVFVSRRAAELVKYASNAFLATKIAFINEIADLCEAVGADILEVSRGVGLDRRIGAAFLKAGPGFGGSCFPKDTLALLATAQRHTVKMQVLESAVAANARRRRLMAGRIAVAMGGGVFGRTIGFLGLTFKAETDDMREAPSVPIIKALQDAGAAVRAYDPQGMGKAADELPDVFMAANPYDCARGCDALVLATEWCEFAGLDLARLKAVMPGRVFLDLRNLLDLEDLAAAGFEPQGVGRPRAADARAGNPSKEAGLLQREAS